MTVWLFRERIRVRKGDLPYVRIDKRLRCIKQTYWRVYCYDSDIIVWNYSYTPLDDIDLIIAMTDKYVINLFHILHISPFSKLLCGKIKDYTWLKIKGRKWSMFFTCIFLEINSNYYINLKHYKIYELYNTHIKLLYARAVYVILKWKIWFSLK